MWYPGKYKCDGCGGRILWPYRAVWFRREIPYKEFHLRCDPWPNVPEA